MDSLTLEGESGGSFELANPDNYDTVDDLYGYFDIMLAYFGTCFYATPCRPLHGMHAHALPSCTWQWDADWMLIG